MATKNYIQTKERRGKNLAVTLVQFVYTGTFVGSVSVEIQHQNPQDLAEMKSNITKRGASELAKLKSKPIIDGLIPNIPTTFTTPDFVANVVGTPTRVDDFLHITVRYDYTAGGNESFNHVIQRPTVQQDIEDFILANGVKQVEEIDSSIIIDDILANLETEFDTP